MGRSTHVVPVTTFCLAPQRPQCPDGAESAICRRLAAVPQEAVRILLREGESSRLAMRENDDDHDDDRGEAADR